MQVVLSISHPKATESSPEQSTNKTRITFLDLPGELRNEIYKLLLVSQTAFISVHRPHSQETIAGNILRVNKQIYNEASSVLYGGNTFILK